LDVASAVEIVLWPIALDFKYSRLDSIPDKGIALSIISGSVRNSEHREMAELLRKKSQTVWPLARAPVTVELRACELQGQGGYLQLGVSGRATVVNPQGVYPQPESKVDGKSLTLPEFYDHVYTLDQIITVDYYLPGCPPPAELVATSIKAVLTGDLPPRGSSLAPRKALCDTCPRNKKKPQRIEIGEIKRIHTVEANPDSCFLAEGFICLGPATRGGCGETCIKINIPCRGCFGPVPGIIGQGPKYLSTLTSLIKAERDEDIKEIIDSIDDPAGYFYRFTEPASILGRRVPEKHRHEEEPL